MATSKQLTREEFIEEGEEQKMLTNFFSKKERETMLASPAVRQAYINALVVGFMTFFGVSAFTNKKKLSGRSAILASFITAFATYFPMKYRESSQDYQNRLLRQQMEKIRNTDPSWFKDDEDVTTSK